MAQIGNLAAGSRHDLHVGLSPDAPDESQVADAEGAFGYVHSYETGSRYDGPGHRIVLFVSGCLLRCTYCHNPDTWHLKDGTYVSAQHVIDRLGSFAPSLRMLDGGLTVSGGEPMVQRAFTRRILAAAKQMGLLLDIKSGDPETYRRVTERQLAPTLRFAERLAAIGKPTWVRFTLVPGLTDDPANVEAIARFVAPMKNVEWVEVQPFHQMGAFKWKAMNLEYKEGTTPTPTPELVNRVLEQFRAAGCKAR
jgi:pyruvate formate lyase activating enzyme